MDRKELQCYGGAYKESNECIIEERAPAQIKSKIFCQFIVFVRCGSNLTSFQRQQIHKTIIVSQNFY